MRYTEQIDAAVTMTVRWTQGGPLVARASAVCEYQPGSTASAEVELPADTAKAIQATLTAALPAVEEELGRRLSRSRHEAARVGAAMGEQPPKGPAKGKGTGIAGATAAAKVRR